MLQKFILNDMAKELSKHELNTLNNIIRCMVGSPYAFLDPDERRDYDFWFRYRRDVDALSPLTVRVFYWIADQLGGNTIQIFQLWKDDQLIFYPDVPGRLSKISLESLEKLEQRASRKVEEGEPVYLVYDSGFSKLGLTSIRATKTRGKMPFNLADRDLPIQFFEARRREKEKVQSSQTDEFSKYRNTKKFVKLLNPDISSKEYKRQFEVAENVSWNNKMGEQFAIFKAGLKKVSNVKFANPEFLFLTIQANTVYSFRQLNQGLGKYFLAKAMGVIALNHEDWEV